MGNIFTTKKGVTLVEIVVVVALLAVIIIIAVPSIIDVYNNAKLNAFLDEAKTIYRNIETSYNNDFMTETIKVNRYCDSKNSYIRKLQLEKPDDVAYDIELSDGVVTKFYVVDNTYQLLLGGNNIEITDINANNVQKLENFEYDCNGVYGIYCNVEHLPCTVVPSFQYDVRENNA